MGLPQGPVAVIKALAGRPCGLLGSVSRPLVEIERSAVGRGGGEASWRPQMVSMGAVRWKQRRPFRGERRRREVWKKLGDDQLMARPRLPSFQPAACYQISHNALQFCYWIFPSFQPACYPISHNAPQFSVTTDRLNCCNNQS